jgi:hypothetical protein
MTSYPAASPSVSIPGDTTRTYPSSLTDQEWAVIARCWHDRPHHTVAARPSTRCA